MIDREHPRSLLGLRDQEIALVRVAMLDQIGEDVELADVPCIYGVGVEPALVQNVGRVRDVLQPVLHDTQHLVRTLEGRFHGGGVVVVTLELRNRNHAQRRRRHDVFVRVHQQLLDRVRGEVVARHVVEPFRARLGPAQLDSEGLPPPKRNLGLGRDIPRGLRPALVCGHDLIGSLASMRSSSATGIVMLVSCARTGPATISVTSVRTERRITRIACSWMDTPGGTISVQGCGGNSWRLVRTKRHVTQA